VWRIYQTHLGFVNTKKGRGAHL
jgi:hypothetical protein